MIPQDVQAIFDRLNAWHVGYCKDKSTEHPDEPCCGLFNAPECACPLKVGVHCAEVNADAWKRAVDVLP